MLIKSFKINVTICNPIQIYTDYVNYIQYSLNGINWSTKEYGYIYICNFIGIIYINITSTINKNLRFYINQGSACEYSVDNFLITINSNNSNFIDFELPLNSNYSNSYSTYIKSDNCELNSIYLYYISNISCLKYNYSISHLAWGNYYVDNYNLSYYITTNQTNCSILIYISNNTLLSIYTSNVLFYNNSQILDYLQIGNIYNLSSFVAKLDGGLSTFISNTINHTYLIQSMNNSEVFKNIEYLNHYDFSPLLNYYNIYINTTININNYTIFNSNFIVVNNSFANITIKKFIPIYIKIINSNIIASDVKIEGISFSGNNTLNLLGSFDVNGTANFSGNINININNNVSSIILITYLNHTGEFSNITINNISACKFIYAESQLMILTRDECSTDRGDSNDKGNGNTIILYIVIPITVVVIIIIISIVLLKVKLFRKKLFPHRDRTFFKPTPKQ